MKLSQFDTKLGALLSATLLSVAQFATAAELHPAQLELANKNGHRYIASTSAMGGVSDGGGNAVAGTLFDFYENQGSNQSVTVEQFIALEPLAGDVLAYLNSQVPAVKHINSGGFGDALKKSLSSKKIIIEAKDITSPACLNQSMVATDKQKVVACQNDLELRINTKELASLKNANNRAGLIIHELILSWAQSEMSDQNKQVVEQKVRQLNREIFASFSQKIDLTDSISEIFNVTAYNPTRFARLKALPQLTNSAISAYCSSGKGLAAEWNPYFQDDLLKSEVGNSIQSIQSITTRRVSGADAEKAKETVCEGYKIDRLTVRAPDMDMLPAGCVRHLNESVQNILKLKSSKDLDESDRAWFLSSAINGARITANLCTGLRGIALEKTLFMTEEKGKRLMNETYFESFRYIRYYLRKAGVSVSFMDRK